MQVTARTSINDYELYSSASTTTSPELPDIDWSFLFKSDEDYLREEAEKEIQRQKENKLRIKIKRRELFTKKGLY